MNIFELFNKSEYQSMPLICNDGSIYKIEDVKKIITPVAKSLMQNDCNKVVIVSAKNFDFVINFLASVFAGKEIFLLTDSKKISILDFDFIKLDEIKLKNQMDCDSFSFDLPDFDNTFFTLFTSGSTGVPKKVKKNLRNIIDEAAALIDVMGIGTDKRRHVITSTTANHMYGLSCWFMTALWGYEQFLLDTTEVLYPDAVDLDDKVLISTPTFLDKFFKFDVPLTRPPRLIMSAGDKLKLDTYKYIESFNTCVMEIYGCTETGTIAYKKTSDKKFFDCIPDTTIDIDEKSQLIIKSPYFLEDSITLFDVVKKIDEKSFIPLHRADRTLKIQEKRINAIEIENYILATGLIESCYCLKHGEKLACAAVLNEKGKAIYLDKNLGGRTNLIKQLKAVVKDKSEIIPQKWRFVHEIPKTNMSKNDKEKINALFDVNLSLPLVLDYNRTTEEAIYDIVFSKCCNFFDGHFKDFPILPGVVQLYFAHRFAKESFGDNILESPAKKVKFSHIIRPDEKIKLSLKLSGRNIVFNYQKDNIICSSGIFEISD